MLVKGDFKLTILFVNGERREYTFPTMEELYAFDKGLVVGGLFGGVIRKDVMVSASGHRRQKS